MDCTSCGEANRAGARFCGGCGKPLAPRCPACGAESEPGKRYCDACGASLVARAATDSTARKIVTIVFADLVGSTALHERLDAESARLFMERYYRAMRGAVEGHGGTVTQLLGDGVKAVFGAPRVAEDDAIRAVRAALDMQRAFRELAREQIGAVGKTGLRVAVNTGEVVANDETEIIGDPVNVAARLQEEARDGDVVIGESTRRLVAELVSLAPLGSFRLKGRSEAVAAYRVVSLDRPASAPAIAFVGREDELRRITAVYDAAVAAPAARLAVILGSPGLGKSRLIDEFARRLGDGATVLTAHCDAAGGATFAPLAKALRTLLRIDTGGDGLREAIGARMPDAASDQARITDGISALLAGAPASPEETFFVVRRLLTALAAAQPVVLAIDDLQWAEPLLLDLVEHLVQWSTGVPLLVLVAARPELRDVRSSLASAGGLVHEVVTLAGLDAGAATRLAANVIGAELPAALAGRVLATSEGNPLFLGELVRMLVNDGALVREGDRWTTGVELTGLEMPPTIHALLAARIERLRPEERTVLERAAVVGRQFSRAAVAHLVPREITDLDARLESLRRSELIEPDAAWFLGEPGLRFHHGLIRDAAYRRVLKGTRAELHGRFADWVEAKVGEAVEHDETLGWHLEQAHQHLRELGPIDAPGRVVGERAARYLAAAGRRALARDDVPPAASLLGRALDRLDAADPARAELALDWCEALLAAGEVGPAVGAIAELARFTSGSDRLRAWHTSFAGQLAVLTDPQALHATAGAVAAAAEVLASAGDTAGEAKAHSVHAAALARLGKVGACEAALDRALAAARRAHDRRRSNAVLAGAPLAALWGPSPVTRASGRCLDVVRVLRITQGAPAVEAVALSCQGVLEALRGRTEAARRMIASARHMVEELGITHRLLETDVFAGRIELLEGDAVAAERYLRTAYDGLRRLGLGIDAAQAAALLARALLALDRDAEAEALSHESEALAGDDLRAAIAWRGARAEALARRGEHTSAVELASNAVDIAAATDALLDHADARLALAAALRAAGRSPEAGAEEARAIELWEAKGATLLAERARRGDGRAVPAHRAPEDHAETARPVRRRVRANAATANAARLDAAVAARDADALETLYADRVDSVNHSTGTTYDRRGSLATWRSLLSARDPIGRHQPLATLGDSLALFRLSTSAGGFAGRTFDVGPYEREEIPLIEVDAQGRRRGGEFFASDRLGDAVARLYERYADLLPEGPARVRAAATARSVATLLGSLEVDRYATALAPAVEFVDHRLLGLGRSRGAGAFLRALRVLHELAADPAVHDDDVLDLRPDRLLVCRTTSGTDRAGGGAFERCFLSLWAFGGDGLVTKAEWFDSDREDEALARIDELTPEPPPPKRRVRSNAATANAAGYAAAVAARDADAFATLCADDVEVVNHPTGLTYDRRGVLTTWRALLEAPDSTFANEPLATLGDSLALCRVSWSASGASGRRFDIGAFESERILHIEVDAQGRRLREEGFNADRLGDAVARLYERHAELLPDGPERARAAATARSLAASVLAGADLERLLTALAPDLEHVDRRTLGLGSTRGAEAFLRGVHALRQLSEDFTLRIDDILDLRPNGVLGRVTTLGTDRASGGAFERPFLLLLAFGSDGLVSRWEQLDVDRDAEALARFDELAGGAAAVRRLRSNAATTSADRFDATIAARDADALLSLLADEYEVVDHATGTTWDRQGFLASWGSLLRARDPTWRHETLASLGDSLALCRLSISAGGFAGRTFDVGAYEREEIALIEADAQGRRRRSETFPPDALGDAVARLYERYAELLPDGPARERAAATARSAAAYLRLWDPDRYAAALAPTIEVVDHRTLGTWSTRGAEGALQNIRAWSLLVDNAALRQDDILGLQSDALLGRRTFLGTDRAGGGAFERQSLQLWVFGSDGLLTRLEYFDADCDAEALARFDELTAEPPPAKRRVGSNAATANAARFDAAVAARDADAFLPLLAARVEVVDHTTGATFDRRGLLATQRSLLGAGEPTYQHEPLATLGASLALCRGSTSASGFVGAKFDVGAYERAEIVLIEADAQGRRQRLEVFESDRLGDAIARLYERYAELLPDGAARASAAATSRSVAAALGPYDADRYAEMHAPAIEYVDHRTYGVGSLTGVEAVRQWQARLLEVAADVANRFDDLLCLRPDALLVRCTNVGTERAGGGSYERYLVWLGVFGADGLMTRLEIFEGDRDAEALARFDELAAEKRERRVRPNAATAHAARVDATIAARDGDALPALLADSSEVVDHTTGTTWDRQGFLATWHSLLSARDPTLRHEPLASLGDSLALCRVSTSASGFAGRTFDVGAYERETIVLIEVDAQGRRRRSESFASDRLGDAIVRLYERYADLLPDGPARARATPTARSVATLLGPPDLERWATVFAPSIEVFDPRTVGIGSVYGAEAVLRLVRALFELSTDFTYRVDEILDLRSDALLVRWTNFGTDRASGGPFERNLCPLWIFGADGLVLRWDQFDADRDAEALTRFDELTAERPAVRRRVRPNSATAHAARLDATIAARDADALPTLLADSSEVVEHATGATFDGRGLLASWRSLLSARDPTHRHEPLATLGDSLALCRLSMSASGFTGRTLDVGAYQSEVVVLIEADAQGRRRQSESFASDHLGDAIARLYARYAELLPDGPARARAAATARSAAAYLGPHDPDRYKAALAPTIVAVDHRTLGTWSARGAEAVLQNERSWLLLTENTAIRNEEILRLQSDALLVRRTFFGTDRAGGGAFERQFIHLWVFGSAGLVTHFEYFDADRDAEALARLDELMAEPLAPRIENVATRTNSRVDELWRVHDWEGFAALLGAEFRNSDRRRMVLLELDRDQYLESMRLLFAMTSSTTEVLATRGSRLALVRVHWKGSDDSVGPSEGEFVLIIEVDDRGRIAALVHFDPDALDAAYAELDKRYAADEAAPYARTLEMVQRIPRAFAARDWEQLASVYAADLVFDDHRLLGWGTRSRDEVLAQLRVMVDLAPDVMVRVDHVAINHRGTLNAVRWVGSRDGGAFEIPFINVMLLGADSRIRRNHTYDLDQLDAARACFDALAAEPPALRIENAATRASDRVVDAWEVRDWKRWAELFPAGFRCSDRRRMMQVELDRDQYLEYMRTMFEMSSSRFEHETFATRGNRLSLHRLRIEVADRNIGPSEIESIAVVEVDDGGEPVAAVRFDSDDLDAAYAELDDRYGATKAPIALLRRINARDWDGVATLLAPELVIDDHRRLGWETMHGPAEYVASLQALVDLAPDARLRFDHLEASDRGAFGITMLSGTREGGAFEDSRVIFAGLDANGRVRCFDFYDLDQLDEARARFAELRPDPA